MPSPFFIQSKLDLVIDIQKALTTAGTPLDAYTKKTKWPDWDNQLWLFQSAPTGTLVKYYYLESSVPGLVIDIDGGGKKTGLQIASKSATAASQLWRFVAAPGETDYYFILNNTGNLVIDIQGGGTKPEPDTLLDVFKMKTKSPEWNNQIWKFVDDSGKVVKPSIWNDAHFSVTAGRGDFSFQGVGFVPGSTVQVTSTFSSFGTVGGGPYTYTVAADGSFGDIISVDYFQAAGSLTVQAVDTGWGITKAETIPAGG